MANRLTKIYTRTGDDGNTGMADGTRVAKDDLLVCAIGDIDELNSQLAVLACFAPDNFAPAISIIQNELFNAGAELSMGQQMLKQQQEELSSLKDIVNETKKDVDLGSIEKSLRDSGEEVMSDYHAMSDSDTSKNDEPQAEKISS